MVLIVHREMTVTMRLILIIHTLQLQPAVQFSFDEGNADHPYFGLADLLSGSGCVHLARLAYHQGHFIFTLDWNYFTNRELPAKLIYNRRIVTAINSHHAKVKDSAI